MKKQEIKQSLIKFVENAKCFDNNSKLKLLLFLSGVKPNTYITLRITSENLDDQIDFEKYLKKLDIIHNVSRAKGFEEIKKIKNNIAFWKIKGVWFGYDLFKNEKSQKDFKKYKKLLKEHKHKQADFLAGKIYDYPKCCINSFIKEQDEKYLAKKYSYCSFYKRLHENDVNFPFVQHTPCTPKCKPSQRLNKRYSEALKKISPKFFREFTKTKKYTTDIIVDDMNDVTDKKGKSIWPEKDCFDYVVITKDKINGRHYLISWLSNKFFDEGTVLSADVVMKYDYAKIKVKKVKKVFDGFFHERHFVKP